MTQSNPFETDPSDGRAATSREEVIAATEKMIREIEREGLMCGLRYFMGVGDDEQANGCFAIVLALAKYTAQPLPNFDALQAGGAVLLDGSVEVDCARVALRSEQNRRDVIEILNETVKEIREHGMHAKFQSAAGMVAVSNAAGKLAHGRASGGLAACWCLWHKDNEFEPRHGNMGHMLNQLLKKPGMNNYKLY